MVIQLDEICSGLRYKGEWFKTCGHLNKLLCTDCFPLVLLAEFENTNHCPFQIWTPDVAKKRKRWSVRIVRNTSFILGPKSYIPVCHTHRFLKLCEWVKCWPGSENHCFLIYLSQDAFWKPQTLSGSYSTGTHKFTFFHCTDPFFSRTQMQINSVKPFQSILYRIMCHYLQSDTAWIVYSKSKYWHRPVYLCWILSSYPDCDELFLTKQFDLWSCHIYLQSTWKPQPQLKEEENLIHCVPLWPR